MKFEVALSAEANSASSDHLLQHYSRNDLQEDLCFGLWRPSTGSQRYTALLYEVLLPQEGERLLHGNASFQPQYIARAISIARQKQAGVAFMHSHPGTGWQGMSNADIEAERDVLAYPAGATGLPLVGLTIGSDGYWSSRFWQRDGEEMCCHWCAKTRIVGPKSYQIYSNDHIEPPPERKEVLRRTFDTWGQDAQSTISRLRVGIVGLGSVGSIVAEAIARIGVSRITLIDPDRVEEHNLDRLLHATTRDIGKQKVQVASESMRQNATADNVDITALPMSIHDKEAYDAALDCDVIFSCVDRPLARDVLNYIAQAHMIPVIDGGRLNRNRHIYRQAVLSTLAGSSCHTLSPVSAVQRSVQLEQRRYGIGWVSLRSVLHQQFARVRTEQKSKCVSLQFERCRHGSESYGSLHAIARLVATCTAAGLSVCHSGLKDYQ